MIGQSPKLNANISLPPRLAEFPENVMTDLDGGEKMKNLQNKDN